MATPEDLIDLLTDEEIDALETIVKPGVIRGLRSGSLSEREKIAVKMVDRMIDESPELTQPITIFRSFGSGSKLRTASSITENSFLTGSKLLTAKGNNVVTLSITVPAGTRVLELPGGAYVLERGISLDLEGGGGDLVDATFQGSAVKPAFSVGVIALAPTNPEQLAWQQEYLNQFHLTGQHDQSSHSRGSKGGGKGGAVSKAAPGAISKSDADRRAKELDTMIGKKKQQIGDLEKRHNAGEDVRKDLDKAERDLVNLNKEKRLNDRERRLQQKDKTERKAERRRNRQQVVDTLLQVGGVIAGVAAVAGLLISTGLVDPNKVKNSVAKGKGAVAKGKENMQRKNNVRNLNKLFNES